MEKKKCPASQDGVCRNVLGYGTVCSGYSTKCSLKPLYDNRRNIADGLEKSIKSAFGIVGDGENGSRKL